ncbi:Ig-like domain repeat protein [Micromonospora echinospora]|uniref:RCC1 domain-containing protein n=1 Tax=Micromonospora echinospora TaxID=1877 RepID=UPI003A8A8F70
MLPVLAVALSLGLVGASPAFAHAAPSPAAVPPGTGLAWGWNAFGQLGNGTNTRSNVPVPVALPAGTRITAIDGGGGYSLALTSTGTVLAWGSNHYGQLGNGTNTHSNVPVPVALPTGTRITAIDAGHDHSLALTSTGTVLAWGDNSSGELGNGTNTRSRIPVPVALPTGTRITAIDGGSAHSLALTSTGTMLAWGDNSSGELGNGTNTHSNVPVPVALPTGTRITAIDGGTAHSLALTSTGTMLAWGYNHYGQLGNGTNTHSNVPVPVSLPNPSIVAIATGSHHSLALTSTGTMLAWGYNHYGQLGNGTNTHSNVPVAVDFLPTITATDAGGEHSLVLTSTGTMYAWGYNTSGQLGNGTNTSSSRPVPVNLPAGTRITAIAAAYYHTLALTAPSTSTTTLRVSPPDPGADPEVTLTATVTCTAGTPTGTVTFLGGTTMGTAPLSGSPTATAILTRQLQPGRHTIVARYNGNGTCPPAESEPIILTLPGLSSP